MISLSLHAINENLIQNESCGMTKKDERSETLSMQKKSD
jgi:hypothetical protein